MGIFNKVFGLLFGLALIGALGAGGFISFKYILMLFRSMDPQVAAVTAVVSCVALFASLMVASSIRYASKQNRANLFLKEKAEVYPLFIDFWTNLLRQGGGARHPSPICLPEKLETLERLLALYGSSALIKTHTHLQALERESGTKNPDARSQVAKGLVQIRKELGLETEGLVAGDMEKLLFSNFDNLNSYTESKNPRLSAEPAPNG